MFDSSGRCVANVWMPKVATNLLRSPLGAPHEASDVGQQLAPVPRPGPSHHIGLDVVVEILVRVELGAVAGQADQANLPPVPCLPPLHGGGLMAGMPVDDHEDLPPGMPEQPLQKGQPHDGREAPFEDHEGQVPTVGDGRDHLVPKALARAEDHRCLPASAPGAAGLVVGPHPRLVAPEDPGAFPARQGPDGGVLRLEPTAYGSGVLLVSPPQRLLRGEAPSPQIPPHGPDRQANAEPALDQGLDCLAGPQHKRQFELVRAPVGDQPHRGRRLVRFQFQDAGAPPRARLHCPQASLAPPACPGVDRLTGDAKDSGRFGLGHPCLHDLDDPETQRLLGRRVERAHVSTLHG